MERCTNNGGIFSGLGCALCALCFVLCLLDLAREGGGVAKEPGSSCQQSVAAHTKELTTP